MDEFVIEKGIPVPAGMGRGKHGESKYPFGRMEPGDSVVIHLSIKTVGSRLDPFRKRGIKLVSRKIDENSSRVWRVE